MGMAGGEEHPLAPAVCQGARGARSHGQGEKQPPDSCSTPFPSRQGSLGLLWTRPDCRARDITGQAQRTAIRTERDPWPHPRLVEKPQASSRQKALCFDAGLGHGPGGRLQGTAAWKKVEIGAGWGEGATKARQRGWTVSGQPSWTSRGPRATALIQTALQSLPRQQPLCSPSVTSAAAMTSPCHTIPAVTSPPPAFFPRVCGSAPGPPVGLGSQTQGKSTCKTASARQPRARPGAPSPRLGPSSSKQQLTGGLKPSTGNLPHWENISAPTDRVPGIFLRHCQRERGSGTEEEEVSRPREEAGTCLGTHRTRS